MPSSAPEPIMVGPYRLIQRLGEGGMGVVHLALDPDGKAVAIKVLRPHIASDPDARLRLEREVATLRRVKHPRVAAVIDADVEGDLPYLVTSFVPGKPLDTYIKEHGPLPRGHVARVGKVLAEALRAIHDAGVVHRDVKPANVMMLDGEPILIDFGIAHVADESRITHTGLVMGTPGYLSPEIIGGDAVSAATDWWGWGATLAFAATGRAPFGTGPIEVVLDRVRRGQSDLEGVDQGLRNTLTLALSVDPARRPPPDALVAGLAAVPPAKPKTQVIDLDAMAAAASLRAYPPGDGTVRVPPAGAAPPALPGHSSQPQPDWSYPVQAAPAQPAPARGRFDPDATTDPIPPQGSAAANVPVNGFDDQTRSAPPGHRSSAYAATQVQPRYAPPAAAPSAPSAQTDVIAPPWQEPVRAPDHPRSPEPSQDRYDAPSRDDEGRGGLLDALGPPVDPAQAGRGLMLGILVVLSLVAAVAPQGAVTGVWVLIAATRVVDHANTALLLRRQHFGQRGSDSVVIGLSLPWRILVSLLTSLLLLVLPVLIGISATFIAAAAWAGNADQAIPAAPGSLAVGMAALLITAWAGPGGGAVRRGSRVVLRGVVKGRRSQVIVWSVIALFVIAAVMVASHQDSPDWGTWEGSWLVRLLSH